MKSTSFSKIGNSQCQKLIDTVDAQKVEINKQLKNAKRVISYFEKLSLKKVNNHLWRKLLGFYVKTENIKRHIINCDNDFIYDCYSYYVAALKDYKDDLNNLKHAINKSLELDGEYYLSNVDSNYIFKRVKKFNPYHF